MTNTTPPLPQNLMRDLIRANHILHYHGAVDAFGHVSVRHPTNADHYVMAECIAPALVSNSDNLVTYHVEDSSPVKPNAPKGYAERFIHGEMFKKYPGVNCVVHSHAPGVLPFCIGGVDSHVQPERGVRLRPVFHMAGFLGNEGAPVWDIIRCYTESSSDLNQDLLVRSSALGASCAAALSKEPQKHQEIPDHTVVLLRRHGFNTYGPDIPTALYRCLYTIANAKAQYEAMTLKNVVGAIGDSGGSSHFSKLGQRQLVEEFALQGKVAGDTRAMNENTQDKAWPLWLREVEAHPLYKLEV